MNAVPPEVALAMIQNRAERLANELRDTIPFPGYVTAAVEGIAVDLADVLAQLPEPGATP